MFASWRKAPPIMQLISMFSSLKISQSHFYSFIFPLAHQPLRVDLAMVTLLFWGKKEELEKEELVSGTPLTIERKGDKGGNVYRAPTQCHHHACTFT